jgi:hypothetical protein
MQDAWPSEEQEPLGDQSDPWNFQTFPPASQSTTTTTSTINNLEVVIDILFIFMSGIAIIVGLIILIYLLIVLLDQFYGCWGFMGWTEEMPMLENYPYQVPSAEAYGPVAYKARLWGLSGKERKVVLERVFAEHVSHYKVITASPVALDLECGVAVEQAHATKDDDISSIGIDSNPYMKARIDQSSDKQSDFKIESQNSNTGKVSALQMEERTGSNSLDSGDGDSTSGVDSLVLDEQRLTTKSCAICLGDYGKG